MTSNHPYVFRPAALDARQMKWLGDIVLIRPATFCVLTTIAAGLATLIGTFLIFGTYTKRSNVAG